MSHPCIKRSVARWLAPGILLVSVAAVDRAQALTYPELQRIARAALDSGEVEADEPILRVQDGTLSYFLGGAGYVLDPNFGAGPLSNFPLESQLRIEVIRKYRVQAKNRNFWEPVFARVEPLVAKQLAVLQAENLSREQKFQQLMNLKGSIDHVYDLAMADHARRRGLQAENMFPYLGDVDVKLVTDPPGGRIYLIHMLENRIAHTERRKPQWRRVEDPSMVTLRGKYYYKIEWPGRTVLGARPIHPQQSGTIVLR